MKILIATGIFPPHIGGPAQYAKNLQIEFEKLGHEVKVATYTVERKLPTGIRHLFFFFKILPKTFWADAVVALVTFSVGFTMRHVSAMIWSTRWQKEMCDKFYGLDSRKSFMVENYYGRKSGNFEA